MFSGSRVKRGVSWTIFDPVLLCSGLLLFLSLRSLHLESSSLKTVVVDIWRARLVVHF